MFPCVYFLTSGLEMNKVFIGVDGGASKTELAVISENGELLSEFRGGPAPIGAVASKTLGANLTAMISAVCKSAKVPKKAVAHFGFGLCGVDYPDEYAEQKQSLTQLLLIPQSKATLVNDGIVALWGGCTQKRAVICQIGTGFTGAYRNGFGKATPFDQVNCGVVIQLRKSIYVTAARVLDGRAPASILPVLLMDYFGVTDSQLLIKKLRRFHFPKKKVAGVLPVLCEAVAQNDKVSIALVKTAAKEYAKDVNIMIQKIGGEPAEAALGGGVLQNGPELLLTLIQKDVHKQFPKVDVHKPIFSPAIGAAIMAASNCGQDPAKIYQRLLSSQ